MKRLSLIGSWKRIGVQAGLLAGIGLAFVGGSQPPALEAAPPADCKPEGMCSFKKPLFLIILDYSTSMNKDFMMQGTRWENAVSATNAALAADNGFVISNFILGLMRFGHDPNPAAPGTTIPNDTSGIVDGQKLDVPFYDTNDPNNKYYECGQGDAIVAALEAAGSPINGNLVGIGTWTKGAMLYAKKVFDDTLADHPADAVDPKRLRSIMLLTDGEYTNAQGTMPLLPADNPSPVAGQLYNQPDSIPTYVVAIGEAMGKAFADEMAMMGGTGTAYDAANPQALVDALQMVVQDLIEQQVSPICTPGLPRIMVLLDASSSMLNLQMGAQRAPMGQGGWELARESLAADMGSIFDQMVAQGKVEDLVHLGLAVFGGNMPDESKILVQYGPCRRDNFKWALDPATSCDLPGCVNPYANAPITWTYKDGSLIDPPGFDEQTLSHMPKCNAGNPPNLGCFGSGTYTHLGLVRIQNNITAYKAICNDPMSQYPCDNGTQFINILITDGLTNSMPGEYNPPLMQMYNAGTTTYVIGFGDGVDSPAAIASLQAMADSGSGNMLDYYDANNQMQLEAALTAIIEGVSFDPCCTFNNCAFNPEPNTNEPDPLPMMTTTTDATTDMTSDTTATTDLTTTGGVDPTTDTDTDTNPQTDPSTDPSTDPQTTGLTTTTAPSTDTEPDPTVPTDPDPTTGIGGTGDSDSSPVPTTGSNSGPSSDTPAETSDGEGSSGSTTVDTGVDDEGGCGCTTDPQGQTRGLLGTFLLGLAGFIRRRRRQ